MRNIFLMLLMSGLLISAKPINKTSVSAEKGVQFFHGTYKEAIAKAEKEGKLVFMDAYAVWCGPCKLMNRNTFPNVALGEYFNKHFVSIKMDMEKEEGMNLNKTFKVYGYPTLIFIDSSGKEITRLVGYRDANTLLNAAKKVVASNK